MYPPYDVYQITKSEQLASVIATCHRIAEDLPTRTYMWLDIQWFAAGGKYFIEITPAICTRWHEHCTLSQCMEITKFEQESQGTFYSCMFVRVNMGSAVRHTVSPLGRKTIQPLPALIAMVWLQFIRSGPSFAASATNPMDAFQLLASIRSISERHPSLFILPPEPLRNDHVGCTALCIATIACKLSTWKIEQRDMVETDETLSPAALDNAFKQFLARSQTATSDYVDNMLLLAAARVTAQLQNACKSWKTKWDLLRTDTSTFIPPELPVMVAMDALRPSDMKTFRRAMIFHRCVKRFRLDGDLDTELVKSSAGFRGLCKLLWCIAGIEDSTDLNEGSGLECNKVTGDLISSVAKSLILPRVSIHQDFIYDAVSYLEELTNETANMGSFPPVQPKVDEIAAMLQACDIGRRIDVVNAAAVYFVKVCSVFCV